MLRVELFVLIGVVIGFPLGWTASSLWRRFLAARDAHVANQATKRAVRVRVADVDTEELLEELSKRSDLGSKKGRIE